MLRLSLTLGNDVVQQHGEEQQCAVADKLNVFVQIQYRHTVRNNARNQNTENRTPNRTDATGNAGAADNRRRNNQRLPTTTVREVAGTNKGSGYNSAERSGDLYCDHDKQRDFFHVYTGKTCGFRVTADSIDRNAQIRLAEQDC